MRLFVRQQGQDGTPLILLHGWGFHSAIWESLTPLLSKNYQVYQVDLPGHGRSSMLELGHYNLDTLADALAARLPKNAIWLGWSLGGLVAQAIALRHPSHVRALGLIGSSPCFIRKAGWTHAIQAKVLRQFAEQLQLDTPGTLNRFLSLQVHGSENARPLLKQLRSRFQENPAQPEALQAALEVLEHSDLRPQLKQLHCPTWLCIGEKDTLVPVSLGEVWRDYAPAELSQFTRINGAGHIPFLSHPQDFNPALQGFLNALPAVNS